jgi:hypothetical protein
LPLSGIESRPSSPQYIALSTEISPLPKALCAQAERLDLASGGAHVAEYGNYRGSGYSCTVGRRDGDALTEALY